MCVSDFLILLIFVQAAATQAYSMTFQVEYAQLRAAMLPAFTRVIHASCSFQTSPPPAIAASLAVTTGLEKHRCEHVLVQVSPLSFPGLMLQSKHSFPRTLGGISSKNGMHWLVGMCV